MTRMPETYLDAASTTPLHPRARAALLAAVDEFGDPSRLYARGRRARLLLDRSRERLAAAVAELREMADLDSRALDRVTREGR
jgi:cysteine desulfurase